MLPGRAFDAIYAGGPDVILAGSFNPTGAATPVDGGFRVTGQWSFASGCQHADWFVAHCLVDDGRAADPDDGPAAADVEIKDTWSVSGLCGTGSHDFVVNDVFVPGRTQLRGRRTVPRRPAVADTGAVAASLGTPPWRSASPRGARRDHRPRHREGTAFSGGDAGVEPAVPEPVGDDRRPLRAGPPCSTPPPDGMGAGGGRTPSPRPPGPDPGRRRLGHTRRPPWSTSPTRAAGAPRNDTSPSSAGSATSTPSPSTSR